MNAVSSASPRAAPTNPLSGARILVVEDDPPTRAGLAELLEVEGHEVVQASGGEEALARLHEQDVDLVLSDVLMPGGDGLDFVARARAREPSRDTPIILISAVADRARRIAALDLGADDYLAKPIDPSELLARVRVHLRHAARHQELLRSCVLDELTGVLNRRGLIDVLQHEVERIGRTCEPLSILMADLDDFKETNDRHGHAAGDEVLRHVGRSLAAGIRAVDRVGRFGGDEFVVVLPASDAAAVAVLAGRLEKRVARTIQLPDGAAVVVRVSLGAATARPGDSVDELLARADEAMYDCKRRRASGA